MRYSARQLVIILSVQLSTMTRDIKKGCQSARVPDAWGAPLGSHPEHPLKRNPLKNPRLDKTENVPLPACRIECSHIPKLYEPKIFISYRRRDAGWLGRALYDYLSGRFGEDRIFFDQSNIESGDVFPDMLHQRALSGVPFCWR
jgi:hypothetical protein